MQREKKVKNPTKKLMNQTKPKHPSITLKILKGNIHIRGMPEREDTQKVAEEISEVILAENFPESVSIHTKPQVQKFGEPSRNKYLKCIPNHITFNLQKIKDKENLEGSWKVS